MVGKWKKQRLNKAFISNLHSKFSEGEFTNKEAYNLYASDHARKSGCKAEMLGWDDTQVVDGWQKMNVRNNLCAATVRGILNRIDPGRYIFSDRYIV